MNKSRIKLTCLILFLAGIVTVLLTDNRAVPITHGFSSGPPAGFSSAPDESDCTACHDVSPNTGPGQFHITAPDAYVSGQTYQITVAHRTSDSSRQRWGFLLTALTAANSQAGSIQPTPITFVQNNSGPGGNRQYTGHNAGGNFEGQAGGASWTFNWTAPAADVGPVTFYAAGNQANGDHTNDGDQIYTRQVTVNPACVTLSAGGQFFNMNGGGGSGEVMAPSGCKWTVASSDDWISLVSADTGSGNGAVSFEVRENFTASARQGTITVGGRTFTIVQDGGLGDDCSYSISPLFIALPASGGAGTITVGAEERCAWGAASTVDWITITSNGFGIANGTVNYAVAPNPGPGGRKGTITVAGRTFAVKQKGT